MGCRSAFRGKEVNDVLKDFDELELEGRNERRRGPGEQGNAPSSCSPLSREVWRGVRRGGGWRARGEGGAESLPRDLTLTERQKWKREGEQPAKTIPGLTGRKWNGNRRARVASSFAFFPFLGVSLSLFLTRIEREKVRQVEAMMSYRMKSRERETIVSIFH